MEDLVSGPVRRRRQHAGACSRMLGLTNVRVHTSEHEFQAASEELPGTCLARRSF